MLVSLKRLVPWIGLLGLLLVSNTTVQAADEDQLRKAAQNPVASMISVPFQNNTFFGVGPNNDTVNVVISRKGKALPEEPARRIND